MQEHQTRSFLLVYSSVSFLPGFDIIVCFGLGPNDVITARKRSLGQGNMFTGVCLSMGGVPDQVHPPEQTPPRTRYTPRSRHPPEQTHPPGADTPRPQDQVHPPRADTPRPGKPPPTRSRPPWDQVHTPQPGTLPLEQTPPWDQVHTHTHLEQTHTPNPNPGAEHAGRHGQCAGGPHPTGMQSCVKKIFITLCEFFFSKWKRRGYEPFPCQVIAMIQ